MTSFCNVFVSTSYSVLLHVEKEQNSGRFGVSWMKITWVMAFVIQAPSLNLSDHVSFTRVLPGKWDHGVLWVYDNSFSGLILLYRITEKLWYIHSSLLSGFSKTQIGLLLEKYLWNISPYLQNFDLTVNFAVVNIPTLLLNLLLLTKCYK
jgi:hypothetical protein